MDINLNGGVNIGGEDIYFDNLYIRIDEDIDFGIEQKHNEHYDKLDLSLQSDIAELIEALGIDFDQGDPIEEEYLDIEEMIDDYASMLHGKSYNLETIKSLLETLAMELIGEDDI